MICNADEAEPGTFKDRQILAEQPHLVIEGMLIAMRAIGAQLGWVFIRHEYEPEEHVLREEIERARAAGVLDGLDIDVFTSPGGYILGEETALIECMEGHRGEPRNKPPFPGGYGLHGKPTLMNNVETFASVPVILERGAEWWKAQGVNGGEGLKFFSVSGHVESPGVFCVPAGTTVGEVIELAGGVRDGAAVAAVQPGGASTNFLGPDCLEVPLTFDAVAEAGSALGTGAMVVLAEGTDLLAAATDVLNFFRNESCGKCVPCRVGSNKAHAILREVLDARRRRGRRRRADRRARGDAAADVDLRARPGRARAGDVRAADAARARLASAGHVPHGHDRVRGARGARAGAAQRGRARGRRRCGAVPARDVVAEELLPAHARATVDGYAVRAADTYAAAETAARVPRGHRRGGDGARAGGRGRAGRRDDDPDRRAAPARRRRGRDGRAHDGADARATSS